MDTCVCELRALVAELTIERLSVPDLSLLIECEPLRELIVDHALVRHLDLGGMAFDQDNTLDRQLARLVMVLAPRVGQRG